MDRKPTYEELEQQVRELEKEVVKHKKVEKCFVDLKRTEEALRLSEERLRLAIEGTTDGIWDWNLESGEIYFSSRYYTMLGYDPDEFPASYESWRQLLHPDDAEAAEGVVQRAVGAFDPNDVEATKKIVRRAVEAHSLYAFEFRLKAKDGEWRWILSRSKVVESDASGRAVRMAGSHTDITERKQAEEALRRRAQQYRIMTSTSMDGFAIVDAPGRILDVNEAYSRMIGYSRYELLNMSVSDIEAVDTPEGIREQHQKTITGGSDRFESRHRYKDGRIIDVEISMTFLPQSEDILVFLRDITERKRTEEAMRESAEHLRIITNTSMDGFVVTDPGGKFLDVNEAYCKILGYSRYELLKMTVADIESVDTPDEIDERIKKATETGSNRFETRHRRKDGRIIDVEVSMTSVQQKGLHLNFVRDITDRKRAEVTIRESEEKYRLLFETNEVLLTVCDRRGVCQLMNWRVADLHGGEPKDFIGKSFKELHPKAGGDYIRRIQETIDLGISQEYEEEVEFFQGKRWLLTRMQPVPDAKGVFRTVQIISQDFTERKQAEEALRASQERLSLVIEGSNDGFWDWNVATGQAYFSSRYYTMLGYAPDEFPATYESWQSLIHPEDLAATEETLRRHFEEKLPTYSAELRLRTRSGDYRWILTRGKVVERDTEGNVVRMSGTHSDITERKQAEKALQESKALLSTLSEATWEAIIIHDRGMLIQANNQYYQIFGYDAAELIGKQAISMTATPESVKIIWKYINSDNTGPYEVIGIRKDGTEFPMEIRGRMMEYAGKKTRVAAIRDITERKQAEEALRREKHFSDTLIDSMPGIFFVFDEQGWLVRWNKRLESTTGYFAEEISHMKPTDFFVGEEKDYISRKFQEVLTKGENEAEVTLMTKGGRTIPHYFTGVRIVIGGKPHILGIGLDISDRKRAESQSARLQLLLTSVIQQSPVPMALALPDGTVEMFNESCRTILGVEDELHLQPGLNLLTMEASWKSYDAKGDYIPLAESPLAWALRGKTTRSRELKVVRKNRTERWILVDAVPIRDENGQIMAGFNIFPDITERKQAEEALEKRIVALTQPLDADEGIAFEDLFNLSEIQRLQDLYAEAFGVAALITLPDGKPITRPSNFSELCSEIIRKTPKGFENCNRSDAMIGRHNPFGPNIQPCLSAGLCNAGAGITVGGHHVANWLIGQTRNEAQKEEEIMAYAREIGADETVFQAAYRKVPVMSQEQFVRVAHVLFEVANQISTTAYQNVQQARFIAERKRAEEAIKFMNTILLTQQETSLDGILVVDDEGKIVSFNRQFVDLWDIPSDVIESRSDERALQSVIDRLIDPEEFLARIKYLYEHRDEKSYDTIELVNGKTFERYSAPMVGPEGKYYGRVWYLRDITERKKAEETLRKRETELEIQSHHLQEVNSALKVLLRQREEDKKELQESAVANVEELVFPYLEKLSEAKLDDRYRAYIKIIQSNLNDIISPFIGALSSKLMRLTPTEVQVANFVKHGKTTKDIAEMLNLSMETIKFHRKNIRDKIGIKNKKANLRTHLLSVQ